MFRTASIAALLALLPLLLTAESQKPQAAPPKAAVQKAPPKNNVPKTASGVILIDRLAAMTPEERDKALAGLPAERRAKILENVEKFNQLPPLQQARSRERLERLNSLAPARQMELRDSMKEFNGLPQPRRAMMNNTMRRLVQMTDEQRRAFMETNAFRNRFSANEQRLMNDLIEIFPRQ